MTPLLWHTNLTKTIISLGFESTYSDVCAFYNHARTVYALVFVNNILITGSDEALIRHLKEGLQKAYEVKEINDSSAFLGLKIMYDIPKRTLHMPQGANIQKILRDLGMDKYNPLSSPGQPNHLEKPPTQASDDEWKEYSRWTGKLQHVLGRAFVFIRHVR